MSNVVMVWGKNKGFLVLHTASSCSASCFKCCGVRRACSDLEQFGFAFSACSGSREQRSLPALPWRWRGQLAAQHQSHGSSNPGKRGHLLESPAVSCILSQPRLCLTCLSCWAYLTRLAWGIGPTAQQRSKE